MPRLLGELGIEANKRTHRGPCPIHGGSNPTAFSWTDAGLWKCHSCGAGGDKIALVRAVRQFPFTSGNGWKAVGIGLMVVQLRTGLRTAGQKGEMRLSEELNRYFERPNTPMGNSPVGKVMKILALEYPDEELEHIHELARAALDGIGGEHRVQDTLRRARTSLGTPRRAIVAPMQGLLPPAIRAVP